MSKTKHEWNKNICGVPFIVWANRELTHKKTLSDQNDKTSIFVFEIGPYYVAQAAL